MAAAAKWWAVCTRLLIFIILKLSKKHDNYETFRLICKYELSFNGKICTGTKLYMYILGIIEKEGDTLTLFCFFQNGSEGVTKN